MSEFALDHINEVITAVAIKSGRNSADIKLIGVTKTMESEAIVRLVAEGVTSLGENRVQDFLPKYEALRPNEPEWHFIGHLQRNKVKFIIDKVAMIHSLDSLALANEINKRAEQVRKVMDVLIEVNIGDEESKHGVCPTKALGLAREILPLKNIRLQGLMCIAPFVENPEDNRQYFKNMRKLLVDINNCSPHNLRELSMGMSGDYAIAIEEGATMVRIGTALVR
ncbi:MAG: YggS family pyridoxal phosphate-dependent enzyme [Defluviitaleaceae bacterium]|nr:YggS family pyridoxal phosphate-dependent enzyme [Defluviitaleaceae bacterium]